VEPSTLSHDVVEGFTFKFKIYMARKRKKAKDPFIEAGFKALEKPLITIAVKPIVTKKGTVPKSADIRKLPRFEFQILPGGKTKATVISPRTKKRKVKKKK